MYEKSLAQVGLTLDQALIYELLLKNGPLQASKLGKMANITRSLVYKILDDLAKISLIEKIGQPGAIAVFKALHPAALQHQIEQKQRSTKNAQVALDTILPYLASDFVLLQDKPEIQFFEGLDGLKQTWWDSLASKTEICTYGDLEMLIKNFAELNKKYLAERIKRNIKKRAITNDSPFNRSVIAKYDQKLTETKFLQKPNLTFASTLMQIYDNKISFTTMSADKIISVIIADPHIYQMQQNLFDVSWQNATDLRNLI